MLSYIARVCGFHFKENLWNSLLILVPPRDDLKTKFYCSFRTAHGIVYNSTMTKNDNLMIRLFEFLNKERGFTSALWKK